jgi:hypothetical protein
LLATDAVRRPLLPLDDTPRKALAALLRDLGLVEDRGGRMPARVDPGTIARRAVA